MSPTGFRWRKKPSGMGQRLVAIVGQVRPLLEALAASHAARAEGEMKAGAEWMDRTTHARNSLYGRSEGTDIVLGTVNDEYGIFLELGTVHMAPRPIIGPTLESTAQAYFTDAVELVGGLLGG